MKRSVPISKSHGFKRQWCMVLDLTFDGDIVEYIQLGKNWKQMVCGLLINRRNSNETGQLAYNRRLNVPRINEMVRCSVFVQQRESNPIVVAVLNNALFLYRGDLRRKQVRQNTSQPGN